MDASSMDELWRRARAGHHCAIVGRSPVPVTRAAAGMLLVRVTCEGPASTRGPLDEARTKILALLGEPESNDASQRARSTYTSSPRDRLLGRIDSPTFEDSLVRACNRLAERSDRPSALVIDGVDAADDATLRSLTRLLRPAGRLRLPLVIGFRARPRGAAVDVLDAIRASTGEGGIVAISEDAVAPARARMERERTQSDRAPNERVDGDEADTRNIGFDWSKLPPGALRVVRAGAVIGTVFEVELVAALLDISVDEALDALQRAADAGAPIADAGEGRLSLPPGSSEVLAEMTLPSLLTWWHRRLAALLGPSTAPRETGAPFIASPAAREAIDGEHADLFEAREPRSRHAEPETENVAFDHRSHPHLENHPPGPSPSRASPTAPSESGNPGPSSSRPSSSNAPRVANDPARAAQHLRASQDVDAACERFLAAADEVAATGDELRAAQMALAAIDAIDGLPASDARGALRANALLHVGRAQAHGAGNDATLQAAVQTLEAARAALPASAPAGLTAEIAAAIAAARYDIGDAKSLDLALGELTAASRLLLEGGEALRAAQLLNDQAAVFLRLGDPVRAMSLLERSREIFEEVRRRRPDDPVAAHEIAETDHLIARVLLHGRPRPGREADAYSLGVDYAHAAERAHRASGRRRELARVLETLARLETKRGRLDRAQQRVSQAADLQNAIGDVTGLARTAAASADLLVARGQAERALSVLSESIALNVEKGSPIGLAFNRRAFDALLRQSELEPRDAASGAVEIVRQHLEAAEERLGRLVLPGESGA